MLMLAVLAIAAGATAAVVMAARPGSHRHAGSSPLAAAAAYLGTSGSQLKQELRSGETLAQLADATAGKSEAGLLEALADARRERLAAEVRAGTITRARAGAALATLGARLDGRIHRARRAHAGSTG
jgi:hypothetical protein